jgi:hypothetical protein
MGEGVDELDQRFGSGSGSGQRKAEQQGHKNNFEDISFGEGVGDGGGDDVHQEFGDTF